MQITVVETAQDVALSLADRVQAVLTGKPDAVLGLPTGRTPVAAYEELRRRCSRQQIDFSLASSFNLDEFVGLSSAHPGSFRQFMVRHFFSGINLPPERIHFLDGMAADLEAECRRYDAALATAHIDLQILGIGANGHIGFNEPADAFSFGTHIVRLLESTRRDNAEPFGGDYMQVPEEALTMGVGSILGGERIVLAAVGKAKAACIADALTGPVTPQLPASVLQLHKHVEVLLDREAASRL